MIRLLAYADANWVTLDGEDPAVDLLAIPWRRFINVLYNKAVQAWATKVAEERGANGIPPTYSEFDFLMSIPLDGRDRAEGDEDEFISDYMGG